MAAGVGLGPADRVAGADALGDADGVDRPETLLVEHAATITLIASKDAPRTFVDRFTSTPTSREDGQSLGKDPR
ncbi:MAG: hypothetical protein ACXVEX_11195, partial [Actinomycetota bacterium]